MLNDKKENTKSIDDLFLDAFPNYESILNVIQEQRKEDYKRVLYFDRIMIDLLDLLNIKHTFCINGVNTEINCNTSILVLSSILIKIFKTMNKLFWAKGINKNFPKIEAKFNYDGFMLIFDLYSSSLDSFYLADIKLELFVIFYLLNKKDLRCELKQSLKSYLLDFYVEEEMYLSNNLTSKNIETLEYFSNVFEQCFFIFFSAKDLINQIENK